MKSTHAAADHPPEGNAEQDAPEPQQDPAKPQLGIRFWLAFWAIAFTNLAAAFDATTLSVALPAISTTLGPSPSAFWAGTSYLLACTILMLIWVTLSDAFGRRPVLLTALAFFTLGAIICGIAHSWRTLLAGRTIQGLGGGGLVSLTTVIITDLVPLRQRASFNAMVSTVWAVGSATGPVLGGVLAVRGAWRWIFWINLPIVAVGVAGIGMFLRLSRRKRTIREKLALFDFPGSVLFTASVTAFLIPVTWGGVQHPWESWRTLVPLVLGALGLAAFVGYEVLVARSAGGPLDTETCPSRRRRTKKPLLIPVSVLPSLTTLALYTTSTFHGLALFSLVYYMPEYFQSVKTYAPVVAGIASLPGTVTTVPCAILVGVVVASTGRYRWALWVGWTLTCLGIGLLILLDEETSVVQWVFIQGVSGLGIGCLFPSISIAVQASVPQREVGVAATLVLFFRSLGQALGVAVGGVILDNQLRRHLSPGLLASIRNRTTETFGDRALNAVTLVEVLDGLSAGSSEAREIRRALVRSFQVIWMVMCGFAGMNLVFSLFVREYGLDQRLETEQGFVHEGSGENDSDARGEQKAGKRMDG
ncbi:major facilitator superfamily domain-containing protein [Aspergillus pseudodeflectus]|uniref:Major facilitator superfamily domain-containing protein n=1 Tax=Aspergillus pseudodeflectus TaxID=176178 RepID=A0ABR4JFW8_9EURO